MENIKKHESNINNKDKEFFELYNINRELDAIKNYTYGIENRVIDIYVHSIFKIIIQLAILSCLIIGLVHFW